MIRRKRLIFTIIVVLVICITSISICYATLSTMVNITMNKFTQNSMTWNIGFETGTVSGTVSTNRSGSARCGSATATATTISGINPTIYAGDKCTYTIQIQNNGTIDAEISSINITKPSDITCSTSGSTLTCGNIIYKLRYTSSTSSSLVAIGDTIAAKSGSTATSKTVYLTIEHNGNAESAAYSQSGFEYTINFTQN